MLINFNTIKRRACETLNQVQCSITIQSRQLASARESFEAGSDGWLSAVSGVGLRLWSETV